MTFTINLERPDRVNWSTLKNILKSPRHYLHGLAHEREDTEALLRGRAIHCAVYEPTKFASRYVVEPNFHRGMNDDTAISRGLAGGKQAAAAWAAENAATGREVLPADIHADVLGMSKALWADPVASRLLDGARGEVPIEWTDPVTGIECRGRVDHLNGCVADLKSTRDLAWCERDAARMLYHAQLAWYFDGCTAAGHTFTDAPCLLFVESAAPYDVLVLTFDDDALAAGRAVYRRAIDTLAECRRKGEWLGVGGGSARRIQLPAWAMQTEHEAGPVEVLDGADFNV